MDQAIAIEEKLFGDCFESHDQREGMAAFLEKRKVEAFPVSYTHLDVYKRQADAGRQGGRWGGH